MKILLLTDILPCESCMAGLVYSFEASLK
jgi:hypothetical protein